MLTPRSHINTCVAFCVLFLISLGGPQVFAPAPLRAQAGPSRSLQPPLPPQSAPAAPEMRDVSGLFRQICMKCHGVDGTGSQTRSLLSEIPDFTIASWQQQRADAQLMASILDGKGSDMPPQRGKIGEEQVHSLVAYVRAFAPTTRKSGQEQQKGPASAEPEEAKPPRGLFERQQIPVRTTSHVQADSSRFPQRPAPRQSAPLAPGTPAFRELFLKRCVKCHGADGTGNKARDRFPEIPDFTNVSWQARRTDARLLESILDGKGEDMPPVRGKISEQQARGLVACVRAFAPTPGKPEQAEQEGPGLDELPEAVPPRGFFAKLIRWLGKIHPPAVHFPIALLTAAAVAELLRMATGKPAFDAITRYCIWFGTLTAVIAGALGWCAGGFRLTNPSWVLMTHRWLGTSTVACAGLVLLLSEASRCPGRRRTRMSFRVALLVVAVLVSATGFFGGAVVFGLNHYTWPK